MGFLTGYRVLDLTDERGLLAGRMLADLGADVVQVEPSNGNSARSRAPQPPGARPSEPDGDASYVWEAFAANKRGVSVDFDDEAGRTFVRSLAQVADVMIESEGPAVQRSRGLDYDDLRASCPALVYVSITAFGRTGPKADYHDADLVVWAAGGPLDENRQGDRPPVRPSIPQGFLHAAADAAAGAQLALLARAVTGRGQLVDVSAQASLGMATLGRVLAHAVGDSLQDMTAGSSIPVVKRIDQSGSGTATDSALRKWRCKDGLLEFHISMGPATGAFTRSFLRWMVSEGVDVKRFADLDWRLVPMLIESGEFTEDDGAELRRVVGTFLATKTKAEVLEAAVSHKLLCVPIYNTSDLRASDQLQSRDFWMTVGEGNRLCQLPGQFAQINEDAFAITRPAPTVGEHTEAVRREWLGPVPIQRPPVVPAVLAGIDTGTETGEGVTHRPLDGLKVADFSWVVAGPVIGRVLADFGATVVRVESSTHLDTARLVQPFVGGVVGLENTALYGTWNAGKLGLTLNLQREEARKVATDLAGWADVVIESFSPGSVARWGLDYATLSADRDDLIMLSTSINGQTGPLAPLAGFGNIGSALSGFQAIVGWPDEEPFGPFGPYTDFVAPRFSLVALLGALEHRRRTGHGCYIDVSQVEAGIWLQAPEIADNAANGTIVKRIGNADREHAPHGVFSALAEAENLSVRRYVAIAVTTDDQWRALASAMDRADLLGDPHLSTTAGRRAREVEIETAINAWTSTRPALEIEERLQACGVPAHVSANSKDFCTDPQLLHRGHLIELAHPLLGKTVVEGPRYLLSETPGFVERPAPTFGQDNQYVLGTLLGYGDDTLRRLTESDVLR